MRITFAHGAQPKLIETVDVTDKRTTSRRSMGGCQIIRTGLFPHSSDKAVTVFCGLGHTCRRSRSRRSSSAAATLKFVGSAIDAVCFEAFASRGGSTGGSRQ